MSSEKNNAPKFAFFYLLSLVALVFMSVATGMVIFQVINKSVVDVLNQYNNRMYASQLRFAISCLVISTPIFYFVSKQIYKSLFKGELDKEAGVRKWLTYFILLVSAVVMISWLIGTVNSFLEGELTLKFILKALTSVGISATIFTFYLHDIKRDVVEGKKDNVIRIYFWASLVIVVAAFVTSFFFIESPALTRNKKIDDKIVNAFSSLDGAVNNYYNNMKTLPNNIEELIEENSYLNENIYKNPNNGKFYEYKVISEKEYELCADFLTSNKEETEDYYARTNWKHDEGYQCIKKKIGLENRMKEILID